MLVSGWGLSDLLFPGLCFHGILRGTPHIHPVERPCLSPAACTQVECLAKTLKDLPGQAFAALYQRWEADQFPPRPATDGPPSPRVMPE
eukprot:IDg7251t1